MTAKEIQKRQEAIIKEIDALAKRKNGQGKMEMMVKSKEHF